MGQRGLLCVRDTDLGDVFMWVKWGGDALAWSVRKVLKECRYHWGESASLAGDMAEDWKPERISARPMYWPDNPAVIVDCTAQQVRWVEPGYGEDGKTPVLEAGQLGAWSFDEYANLPDDDPMLNRYFG